MGAPHHAKDSDGKHAFSDLFSPCSVCSWWCCGAGCPSPAARDVSFTSHLRCHPSHPTAAITMQQPSQVQQVNTKINCGNQFSNARYQPRPSSTCLTGRHRPLLHTIPAARRGWGLTELSNQLRGHVNSIYPRSIVIIGIRASNPMRLALSTPVRPRSIYCCPQRPPVGQFVVHPTAQIQLPKYNCPNATGCSNTDRPPNQKMGQTNITLNSLPSPIAAPPKSLSPFDQ